MPDLERIKKFKDRVADTATSVAGSAQDTLHETSEKVTDTASSVTGALQDASQKASVKATDAAASAVWSAQDALEEASERVTDTAASVAGSAQDTLQKTSEKVTDTASSVTGALQDASQKASVKATDAAASVVWSAQDALEEASERVTDTAASVAGSTQDTLQETSEKVTDTASSVTGALQDASQKASVKATDVAASAVWSAQDALQEASEQVTDTAASAAGTVQETVQKAPDVAAAAAEQVTSGAKSALATTTGAVQDAAHKAPDVATATAKQMTSGAKGALEATTGAVQDAAHKASDVANASMDGVKSGPKTILAATTSAANALLPTTQGLLASGLSGVVNDLLQGMVKGVPTIYDKAMDARFIETGIGGSYHRLFDGGHTITGAFNAVRGASPDDNIVQEALGTVQGLLRDVSTPRGLPLATWDKETFDQVAATLDSSFHIPKSWFYDLNTFDAAELLGGSVGAVALIFNWNRADTETFARFVGSMGVSSALSANPLLLIVTVVALARAFQKAHQTGEYAEFVDGQLKGGIVSGATLAAVSLVGVAGGPVGMALLVALVTGILVNKATENVSIVQIGQVVARQATAAATEAKEMIVQQMPAMP